MGVQCEKIYASLLLTAPGEPLLPSRKSLFTVQIRIIFQRHVDVLINERDQILSSSFKEDDTRPTTGGFLKNLNVLNGSTHN